MTPKFKHDCNNCKFLGHYVDQDVYICESDLPTIIARYGDDGPEYSSCPVKHFQKQIFNNELISILENDIRWDKSMPFREYLNSKYCAPCHKAWMLALAALPIPVSIVDQNYSGLTPEELLDFADNFPPPQSWFDEDPIRQPK